MLSYRHGFHAGNHADVLKHLCLLALLDKLCRKDKPLCYMETHAGAGCYALDSDFARKTGEFAEGAGRLLDQHSQNPLLANYINQLQQHGERGDYPGSPAWARERLRDGDEILLCEMHPAEFAALKAWAAADLRIHTHQRDGHEAARALLPPRHKRGLVLIDPAYENKQEYQQCADTIAWLRKHYRSACIALWHPRLPARPDRAMLDAVMQGESADILHITLDIAPALGDYGMFGSGMLIIQPPWQSAETLKPALQAAAALISEHPCLTLKTYSP